MIKTIAAERAENPEKIKQREEWKYISFPFAKSVDKQFRKFLSQSRIGIKEQRKWVKRMTSDYAFEWSPPGPEKLRMLISALLEVGVKEEEIVEMAQINPRFLLNVK